MSYSNIRDDVFAPVVVALITALVFVPVPAFAADAVTPRPAADAVGERLSARQVPLSAKSAHEVVSLGPIVVTATGREEGLAYTQASVQVIGPEQLENQGVATSVTDVLRDATGILVHGSSISIRGQRPSGTLVLIDGMPRTGLYGSFTASKFPLAAIERIEIVRGPMSALYGADALGGVINVITKRPGENPGLRLRTTLGVRPDDGERTTIAVAGAFETGDERLGHRFGFHVRDIDGYALAHGGPGDNLGEDFGSVRRYALNYAGAYAPNDTQQWRWRLAAYRQEDSRESVHVPRRGTPEPYDAIEQETRYSGQLSWRQALGPGELTLTAAASHTDGKTNRSYPGPEETTQYTLAKLQARYDVVWGDHLVSAATGVRHDKVDVSIYPQQHSATRGFVLVQDEWLLGDRLSLTAGVRLDHFESFGTAVNPRIVLGSRGYGLTWRLGYGSAFRAPDLGERFSVFTRGPFLIRGNPELQPETSDSYEAAIGWNNRDAAVELVYHESHVDDLISTRHLGRTPRGRILVEYMNVDSAVIRGVELTASWDVTEALSLAASLEYLDAENGATGERLTGRYETAYDLSATYSRGAWDFTGRLRGIGGFYAKNTAANGRGAPPVESSFAIVDVSIGYEFDNGLAVDFGVDNVFDEELPGNYLTTRYRDDAGRFAHVTLSKSF